MWHSPSLLDDIDSSPEKSIHPQEWIVMVQVFFFMIHGAVLLLMLPGFAKFVTWSIGVLRQGEAVHIPWFGSLQPGFIHLAYVAVVGVALLLCLFFTSPLRRAFSARKAPYVFFVSVYVLVAILARLFQIADVLSHSVLSICGALGFLLLWVKPSKRDIPLWKAALLCAGFALCSIVLFSAEDYFSFQADRLLPLVLLATLTLFGAVWWALGQHLLLQRRWWATVTVLLLFVLIVCMEGWWDLYHYGLYLGPVIEHLYGGRQPLSDLAAYYGPGMTMFLSLYFALVGFVSSEGLLILFKLLTFGQYVLLFFVLRSLLKSQGLALLSILAIFVFHIAWLGPAFFETPSSGALRYGLLYVLLFMLTRHPVSDAPLKAGMLWALAAIAAIATVWSSDNVLYTTMPIVGWFVLSRRWVELVRFAWRFVVLAGAAWGLLLLPAVLKGLPIHLERYAEYQLVHSGGYLGLSIYERDLFWMIFAALGLFFAARQILQKQDARITLLALHGLCILTYFVWRGHAKLLFSVSVPFIVLGILFVALPDIMPLAPRIRRMAVAAVLTLFLSSAYFPAAEMLTGERAFFTTPAALALLNPFSESFALSERAFKARHCPPELQQLAPYSTAGGLPLILDRRDDFIVYACLHTFNAFGLNPVSSLEFPVLRDRLFEHIARQQSPFMLIAQSDRPYESLEVDRLNPGFAHRFVRTVEWSELKARIINPLGLTVRSTMNILGESVLLYNL